MEKYLVSARKYRPATFASVVGQKALAATLKNSIATDRLAHAYLFCGSRGVGKTSCARIFAKTINCTNRTPDGEACNECESCRLFNENRSLNIIELDAASNNGVEDIRQLIDQTRIPPTSGKYRVFIVDEVHMLSSGAFNAFLKTLEEPPEYVIFILATTEKHKVIPTILSRCQIFDFNRITISDMVDHLAYVAKNEGISAEPAALNVIARKADGAMRDALSIFDQVAASSLNNITSRSTIENLNVLDSAVYNRLLQSFLDGNVADALLIYKEVRDQGFNNHFFLTGLADYFRDLVVARDPKTISLLESDDDNRAAMAQLAAKCSPKMLYRAMDLCNSADLNYRTAANKQFLIELTLIKLCQADSPSPNEGDGEGHALQPIVAKAPTTPTPSSPKPAPVQAPAPQKAAPAAAPITPPSPAPTAPANPATKKLPKIGLGPSISIRATNSAAPAAAAPTDDKPAPAAPSATPAAGAPDRQPKLDLRLSPEEVRSAWLNFADSRTAEHVMASTLRTCIPRPADANDSTTYTVQYESPAQAEVLEKWLPLITRELAQTLGNSQLKFSLKQVDGEGSPISWTERQILDHLIAQNERIGELVNKLNLTLE